MTGPGEWRLPSLLQSICSIVILAKIWCIPESPRWLINKDSNDEALQILAHYYADGNDKDEFIQLKFTEFHTAITLDKEAEADSWLDLVRSKGNRKRVGIITAIGCSSQRSGNGLMSYYPCQVMNNMEIASPNTSLVVNE